MGTKIGKPRYNPDKKQNLYGSECWWADEVNGIMRCESPAIKNKKEAVKICKFNMHNCCKLKYRRLASNGYNRQTS